MNGNGFIAWLLRSPLHGLLSGNTLLITVTGRKTGRPITTPVNYVRDGDRLWVISNRDRTWWRNLTGGAPVVVRVRGRDLRGAAEALLEPEVVAARLPSYLRGMPMAARALGVRPAPGQADAWQPEDLARAAATRVLIEIRMESA